MMIPARQIIHVPAIACIGLAAWLIAGQQLLSRTDLAQPLNVLGINRSPYGEVIALAVQGPIDQTFQGGYLGSIGRPSADENLGNLSENLRNFSVSGLLARFEKASQTNTSMKRVSPLHRFYLRRMAESKLRFAYNLDPSQYSNYNSLHFFLTEPAIGTRGSLTPAASALAWQTIDYCLKQEHDPRPALTAAAACTNLLQLMFTDRRVGNRNHSIEEMRKVLQTLDTCLARYGEISRQWDASGNWSLLSGQRIQECLERYDFIVKIRNASEKTILNYEMPHNGSEITD